MTPDQSQQIRLAGEKRSIAAWIYDYRDRWWLWIGTAGLSVVTFFLGLKLVYVAIDTASLSDGRGLWTFLTVVAGLPAAFVVWAIRDRNKHRELINQEIKNFVDQQSLEQQRQQLGVLRDQQLAQVAQHKDQLLHRRVEILQAQFEKLQEWATNNKSPILQAAALHQLGLFITSDQRIIPMEMTEPSNPFSSLGMEILRALLGDRAWESEWKSHLSEYKISGADADSSPVSRAIGSILCNENLPITDLSYWNLRGLDLKTFNWKRGKFRFTRLDRQPFSNLDLSKVDFADSFLEASTFTGATLSGTDFSGAEISSCRFTVAKGDSPNFESARGYSVRFYRAALSNANFAEADFSDEDYDEEIKDPKELAKKRQTRITDFSKGTLLNANFTGAQLEGVSFQESVLTGSDFTGANLSRVNFTSANLQDCKIEKKWSSLPWSTFNVIKAPEFVDDINSGIP